MIQAAEWLLFLSVINEDRFGNQVQKNKGDDNHLLLHHGTERSQDITKGFLQRNFQEQQIHEDDKENTKHKKRERNDEYPQIDLNLQLSIRLY